MKRPRRTFLEGLRGWLYRRGLRAKHDSFWYSPSEALLGTMLDVSPSDHIIREGYVTLEADDISDLDLLVWINKHNVNEEKPVLILDFVSTEWDPSIVPNAILQDKLDSLINRGLLNRDRDEFYVSSAGRDYILLEKTSAKKLESDASDEFDSLLVVSVEEKLMFDYRPHHAKVELNFFERFLVWLRRQ